MEEKKRGKLETILYLGIFPLIFTAVFGIIILNLMDISVMKTFQDWGNKIPIISKIIPDSNSAVAKEAKGSDNWKQKYLTSEQVIEDKQKEIVQLTEQLSSNQSELKELEKNSDELQKKLGVQNSKARQEQMKRVAGIYANIPASKAAAMFQTMTLEEASYTLSLLNQELQSSIIGSIKDAKKAAQITTLIKEIAMLTETDEDLLKIQIYELAQKQANPADLLTETIAGMPPAQSAGIIQSMMGTNSQVAIDLMKKISTDSRSQILTEIAKVDSRLAAQITENLN
jgi:flagellar motility protein MotE (MotC chaperone)